MAAALTAVALTFSTSLSAVGSEHKEHKVLPAEAGGSLTFSAVSGSIEIKTHDEDEVIYDAELKAGGWFGGGAKVIEQLEFVYEQSDGDVKIAMKWKNGKQPRHANLNGHHTLLIPARYNVDVKTAGGKIKGKNIDGTVAAHTSGGSIRFGKVNGEVKVRTSGGSITIEDIEGSAEARTSGGSITVGNVDGSVTADTSGGGIKIGSVAGEIKGKTSGGSISAALIHQISRPVELRTSGGSIRLTVPDDFQADLSANTSGGKVSCELPVKGTVAKRSIDGKINGGGPKVSLRTSGGGIQISSR